MGQNIKRLAMYSGEARLDFPYLDIKAVRPTHKHTKERDQKKSTIPDRKNCMMRTTL